MKLSTKNVELTGDVSANTCDGCGAKRADVDVRGRKVTSVEVRCEVADAID
ncbi:hypothetical protein HZC21_03265 [Candidatus Peregrinibacteria bacterium]|nr:hypothetical protein [Candidatus Peregrinibacteria bacterium]